MPPPATFHRVTLRFHDPALERRYRDAEDGRTLRYTRIAALAGAVLTFAASVVMHLFVPVAVLGTPYILLGGVIICGMFGLAYAATFTPLARRRPHLVGGAAMVFFALGMLAVFDRLPQEFVQHRGFLLVLTQMFAMYGLLRLRVIPGAIAGGFTLVLYVAIMQVRGLVPTLDLMRHGFWLFSGYTWGLFVCYQLDLASRREFVARENLREEQARAERLLLNILPAPIAERLKASPQRIAEHAEQVTVLFADIVGFTPLSARKTPAQLVDLLDRIFSQFDQLAAEHGLEKIKTIGDAYMAVAGLPDAKQDHALRAARMALAIVERVERAAADTGEPLQVRVGLHSGPVVAGVIGRSKFSYDLWGDTVNTASRMESLGVPGAVQCTGATAERLRGSFALHSRGTLEVKGKDRMETFLVTA